GLNRGIEGMNCLLGNPLRANAPAVPGALAWHLTLMTGKAGKPAASRDLLSLEIRRTIQTCHTDKVSTTFDEPNIHSVLRAWDQAALERRSNGTKARRLSTLLV